MAKDESLFNAYFIEYKEPFVKDATTGKLTKPKLQEIADRIEHLNQLRLSQPGKAAMEIPELIEI
ncbi:MAG: hypothetical protein IT236_08875 [Bacteroidia bacterium]|nr:hypothetical protein [Bacteroidia bacterium]